MVGGQLKLKDGISLDHEAEPTVTVQVTATDAGGLSYSEDFTINVTNVNEVATDIALSNANVAENAAGAVIGTLSTTDPDAGDSHSYAVSDARFEVVGGTWGWASKPVVVDSVGLHVVSVLAREDGFRVDKIVVNRSQTPPTGAGPDESPTAPVVE